MTRLFALERGAPVEVVPVDMFNYEHRRPPFTTEVNRRGEMPALVADDGTVITELTAICEYLDEVSGGPSLIGETAEQRGNTRMWTRRVYLTVCHPAIEWWRCTPAAEDFYHGHRVFMPEAMHGFRATTERGLNWLEEQMGDRPFIAGDRYTLADTMVFAFMDDCLRVHGGYVPWLNTPARPKLAAWYERIKARPTSERALNPLPAGPLSH